MTKYEQAEVEALIKQDAENHTYNIRKSIEEVKKTMALLEEVAELTAHFKQVHKEIFGEN